MKDEHPKIPQVMSIISEQLRQNRTPRSWSSPITGTAQMVAVNLSRGRRSKLIGQTKRGEDKGE